MKKSPLNRIGKIGRANIEARKKIAKICEEKGLNRCEIRLEGCLGNWPLAPAHRHRRNWYMGSVEKLSDFKEWLCSCVVCHQKIDSDSKLLEETFKKLR